MKKKGVRYWKKKAWEQFSKLVRVRDALRTTNTIDRGVCVSCGRIYPAFGRGCLQAGHLIAGRSNGILFEPIGCHCQCYNCNVTLKGNWHNHLLSVERFYGGSDLILQYLTKLANQPKKFTPCELEELRDIFKAEAEEMLDTKQLLEKHKYENYSLLFDKCDRNGDIMLNHLWLHSDETE